MRFVSLFSGIEAASVAWEPLGWEAMVFSEIEPFPCAVLAHRFPGVPNLGDIREIDWEEFKREQGVPDVVVGGSPCQSFSIAGKREGLAGASGLMWEFVRACDQLRPRWVVWENVPGALSSANGEDFRCLLASLDDIGYCVAWRVLDAQSLVVARDDVVIFSMTDTQAHTATSSEVCGTLAARSYKDAPVVAFAANQRGEVRLQGGDGQVFGALQASTSAKQINAVCEGKAEPIVRRLTPRECERLQGFPDDWTKVPYRGKPVEECPDTPRYKALGNSMAVPVMRWLGERIDRKESGEK